MEIVADLHLHSKYSRAVSQRMNLEEMALWGAKKGIDLLATADWTHPLWLKEIESKLEEEAEGVYKLKAQSSKLKSTIQNSKAVTGGDVRFLLSTEIASIYSQGGKLRRMHNLVWVPSLKSAAKINEELVSRGVNLLSDGRPITGISSHDLVALILEIEKDALIISAHAWTPWFSLYGSKSGFDSLKECYGDMSQYIYGIETGLSSDPAMNWRIVDLDKRAILSFSDAHSPEKMGREATIFKSKIKNQKSKITYKDIVGAIKKEGEWEIGYTIEFYPEEGKYHFTGHRACGVIQSPEETKKLGTTCAVCGRPLTVGVMHRVGELANREDQSQKKIGQTGATWIFTKQRPPYVMMVPLQEIVAEAFGRLVHSQSVMMEYEKLTGNLGTELEILLKVPIEQIAKLSGGKVAEGVERVRQGKLVINPGYDGVFGKVAIWPSFAKATDGKPAYGDGSRGHFTKQQEQLLEKQKQMSLF